MRSFLREFLANQDGAASAEYILIYAIIGTGFAAAAFYFGTKVKDAMVARGDAVEACGTSSASC